MEGGGEVRCNYGVDRPNSNLLISYGFVDPSNSADFIDLTVRNLPIPRHLSICSAAQYWGLGRQVGLVGGDRLFGMKQSLLRDAGFGETQSFPLYLDRMPTQVPLRAGDGWGGGGLGGGVRGWGGGWQLLTYMRLARLQDVGLFAKVAFERDDVINQVGDVSKGTPVGFVTNRIRDEWDPGDAGQRVRGAAAADGRVPGAAECL